MAQRTRLITGLSSGFGRELTTQLPQRGDRGADAVRNAGSTAGPAQPHPDTFRAGGPDVTGVPAVHEVVNRSSAQLLVPGHELTGIVTETGSAATPARRPGMNTETKGIRA